MAVRTAQTLVDDDDDLGGDDRPLGNAADQGVELELPVSRAPRVQLNQVGKEPPIEIIETDEDLRPLDGADTRLDVDSKPKTLLEQQDEQREVSERKMRRDRQKQGKERTIQENEELRRRLADLENRVEGRFGAIEPRLSQIDRSRLQDQLADLDRRVDKAAADFTAAGRRMAEAIQNGDGEAITAALEARDKARDEGVRLAADKNRLSTQIESSADLDASRPSKPMAVITQPQQQPQISEITKGYVQDFVDRNPWYNPNDRDARTGRPRDPDTQIMLTIDAQVAAEGFRPDTQDYWDELESRAARYLPHRFGEATPAPAPRRQTQQQRQVPAEQIRRGPGAAGGSERVAPSAGSANKFYLSPARKEALIASGVLSRDGRTIEDPVKFRSIAQSYMDWDKTNVTN